MTQCIPPVDVTSFYRNILVLHIFSYSPIVRLTINYFHVLVKVVNVLRYETREISASTITSG